MAKNRKIRTPIRVFILSFFFLAIFVPQSLTGAEEVKEVSLDFDDVDIRLSGASKVEGEITAGDANFNISGASIVRLRGAAEDIVADVSGASYFHLDDFTDDNADINFSGASTGTVNVSDRLDANLSGASKLSYIGEPAMGTINTSGASSLRKK